MTKQLRLRKLSLMVLPLSFKSVLVIDKFNVRKWLHATKFVKRSTETCIDVCVLLASRTIEYFHLFLADPTNKSKLEKTNKCKRV